MRTCGAGSHRDQQERARLSMRRRGMVRHRFHVVFALGKFNEGVKWVRDLNEACRKVGCVEGKLWAAGFGKTNECVIEYDYPDIAAMEADTERFESSKETMA